MHLHATAHTCPAAAVPGPASPPRTSSPHLRLKAGATSPQPCSAAPTHRAVLDRAIHPRRLVGPTCYLGADRGAPPSTSSSRTPQAGITLPVFLSPRTANKTHFFTSTPISKTKMPPLVLLGTNLNWAGRLYPHRELSSAPMIMQKRTGAAMSSQRL